MGAMKWPLTRCPVCGNEFAPKSKGQTYCSRACLKKKLSRAREFQFERRPCNRKE